MARTAASVSVESQALSSSFSMNATTEPRTAVWKRSSAAGETEAVWECLNPDCKEHVVYHDTP